MPRGVTTLEEIVAGIREEAYISSDRNFGIDQYPQIRRLARRIQTTLYWDHDWGFLKSRRDITLNAGQRYYTVPTEINFERIVRVRTQFGNEWIDLERGIDIARDYSVYDSDQDVRLSPAQRWDMINTAVGAASPIGHEMMEIWPIPADTAKVRIDAVLKLAPFVADDDKCTLDDTLIILFGAAELLANAERPDAKAKLSSAQQLLKKMTAGSARRTPVNSFSMAGGGGADAVRLVGVNHNITD